MKIYFAGSIRGGRDDKELYAQIIAQLKEYGDVLTEHIGDQSLTHMGSKGSATDIYTTDLAWITEADVLVAEVTTASLGVGFEIGVATHALKKPVLCLYRPSEGRSLSAMIAGCDLVTNVNYQTLDEIKVIFDRFFEQAVAST